jgi:hypothetical protein
MPEEPPQISILDIRLAEIDRRLRSIQTGLVEEAAAAAEPPATPEAELPQRIAVPEPGHCAPTAGEASRADAAELMLELRELTGVHERLLESMRELLAAYEQALAQAPAAGQTSSGSTRQFSVSAGPFPSTEALRGFERTLARIPEVREVEVRGYEGGDRAIVDVHLFDPTS